MRSTWIAAAGCLALLACRMDDPCAPKGDACGGDPTGVWMVTDSCRDPAYQSPLAITYYDQAQNMARQPPPEPTSSDWCSYLLYDPGDGITNFIFPADTLPVTGGTVTYDTSGDYAVEILVTGSGSIDISASCLSRFSVTYQCGAADASTPAGTRSVSDDLAAFAVSAGSNQQSIVCVDDGNLGCLCRYDLTSEPTGGALSGRWSTQGPLLTHFGGEKLLPSQADLCVSGDTMTVWSHNHAALWNQAGLRTIALMRMTN
jgi:hypothetical protein